MKFLQNDLGFRRAGEIVQVVLRGNAANVLLVDSSNFGAFKAGRKHRYYGGLARRSPVSLTIPHAGHWYVVIHMGGLRGNVNASVQVLPGSLPPIRETASSELISIRQAADELSAALDAEQESGEKEYDVFISHAHADKDAVARPLAEELQRAGLRVWIDEFELKIGDSLRKRIDTGLLRSRFGVVILSKAFLSLRGWTEYELSGLVTRETGGGRQIILPIWHGVTRDDVMKYSPTLADKVARNTQDVTIAEIAAEIADVTQSDEA